MVQGEVWLGVGGRCFLASLCGQQGACPEEQEGRQASLPTPIRTKPHQTDTQRGEVVLVIAQVSAAPCWVSGFWHKGVQGCVLASAI